MDLHDLSLLFASYASQYPMYLSLVLLRCRLESWPILSSPLLIQLERAFGLSAIRA